jgi:two-component system, sensor histidine kinase and response regulator
MTPDQMRVLLVEDDPDDILLVKEALAEVSLGKVKLEYTGRLSRGLIELSSHPYDVILLDLNLPDSRGLETLKTVIKSYPKIPVVVLSGLADDVTTIEAVRRGAQDYLVKGDISGPMLVRVLRYAIERKQAEAVLRESEAKYRALVETTPNGITLTDLDGKIILCNQQTADLHGYNNPDDMVGINVYELVKPADRQLALQNTQKTLKDGRVMNVEYTLIRKDGSQFLAEISATLLRDSSGAPAGFIGSTRDTTERTRALEAESRLIKLREEFIASVSNDLRNPLFSLMGYLDLLRSGKVNDLNLHNEYLMRATKDANRLLGMVNELLDFSLSESQSLALNYAKVDLVALVQDVLQSFREQADARRISLKYAPRDPSLIADVDLSRMRRVLINLVENAIKFSEMDDKVLVKVESMNGNAIINVIDQGCGIPNEDYGKIFDKYYQVNHNPNKTTFGMGLGLYIASLIVEAHGGSISVESKLNTGSKFTVSVPVNRSI